MLIATHVVSDIEFISKQILLIKEGKLLVKDEPARILAGMERKVHEVRVTESELAEVQSRFKVSQITSDSSGIWVRIIHDGALEHMELRTVKPNLEDVYLRYFE
ncbi:MAG: hypothetical protein E6230_16675 [Paenibacillus dendritiformis]|uniref:hypothetical protein n=1 Tax=uncultured Paenibacillus sp. TaxID=227322 RepID=UPI0025F8A85F|nr:hypothetical protein [uncultured Paenibacillus sp.]MDU5143806.1 hypothetical protein [Paenibacillus dendritiformis]